MSSVAPAYSSRLRLLLNILGWDESMTKEQSLDNLWLAQMLFDLGAVQFGDFTLGEGTVSSPVFINPKMLIGNPARFASPSNLFSKKLTWRNPCAAPRCIPLNWSPGFR